MVLSEEAPVGENCMVRNEWICGEYLTSRAELLTDAVVQHVWLTVVSVLIGLVVALPLALLARRYPKVEAPVVGTTTALYTIPSLALFALLLPITGLTPTTVITGLVLYTLTILVRNIIEGLNAVPPDVIEAARGMGYGGGRLLFTVELPLALPSVMAGLRVATVSTVALTTVGAIVNYGGLGNLLLEAVNTQFRPQVLTASVLCVLLAITFDLLLVGAQRMMTPWTRGRAA
ncbi:MAG TPA: ABC transporter permease [Nocardioidaceae bacterium]|nr:ABC transporter permease [Nocardioidaceae bacterium]